MEVRINTEESYPERDMMQMVSSGRGREEFGEWCQVHYDLLYCRALRLNAQIADDLVQMTYVR